MVVFDSFLTHCMKDRRYCILLVGLPICSLTHVWLPWSPEVFNSPRQILTLLNKVPGYWLQGKTDLANKPRNMQIFPHSKFGINRSTGLKVMTKKFIFVQNNFLAITFKPVDRLIPNFECVKICMVGGLFANALKPLSQYPGTLFTAGTKRAFMTRIEK